MFICVVDSVAEIVVDSVVDCAVAACVDTVDVINVDVVDAGLVAVVVVTVGAYSVKGDFVVHGSFSSTFQWHESLLNQLKISLKI